MPTKKNIPDLQKTEYDILRILWKEGPQSVREVHNFIKDIYGWAYTTTKTMMYYHCRECDPKGVWDCVSHHVDMDVH